MDPGTQSPDIPAPDGLRPGPTIQTSRSFPAEQAGVAAASAFLDETLERAAGRIPGLPALSPPLHIILDEICSNIVQYSGASGFEVGIGAREDPPGVEMTFSDDGVAYDPLSRDDPDTTLPAELRPVGGLGLLMVRKLASSVAYRRVGGRNVLAIEKRLG